MSATFIIGFVVLVVAIVATFIYGWKNIGREAAMVSNPIDSVTVTKVVKEDPRECVRVRFAGRWCEGRLVRESLDGFDLVELTDPKCAVGQRVARSRKEIQRLQSGNMTTAAA